MRPQDWPRWAIHAGYVAAMVLAFNVGLIAGRAMVRPDESRPSAPDVHRELTAQIETVTVQVAKADSQLAKVTIPKAPRAHVQPIPPTATAQYVKVDSTWRTVSFSGDSTIHYVDGVTAKALIVMDAAILAFPQYQEAAKRAIESRDQLLRVQRLALTVLQSDTLALSQQLRTAKRSAALHRTLSRVLPAIAFVGGVYLGTRLVH